MAENTSFMTDIMKEYEQIRFENRQLQTQRIRQIQTEIPEIDEIDSMIRDMNIDAALASLHEEPVDQEELQTKTKSLIDKKYQILVNAGYPANYLSTIYTCEKCQDTGYADHEPCECLKQKIVARQYAASNLGFHLKQETFDAFRLDYYSDQMDHQHKLSPRENMEFVYNSLREYTKCFPDIIKGTSTRKANILFQGSTGIGKSFLSNCVANELLAQGYAVLYVSASSLFQQVADVLMNRNVIPGSQQFVKNLNQYDVIIIDDLGSESPNSFTISYLYNLVNDRIMTNKPTIISTNLQLTDIRNIYSERVFSRICDSYNVYNLYGDDIRLLRRKLGQS